MQAPSIAFSFPCDNEIRPHQNNYLKFLKKLGDFKIGERGDDKQVIILIWPNPLAIAPVSY